MRLACLTSQVLLVVIYKRTSCFFIWLPLIFLACSEDNDAFGRTDTSGTTVWSTEHLLRVNQHRQANDVILLRWNERLASAALAHAEDMSVRDYFAHESPEGHDVLVRVMQTDYPIGAVGENLARGPASNNEVIDAWMQSPGHRENIIFPEYTEMGAARVGDFWVQVFGTPAITQRRERHFLAPQSDG